MNKKAIYRQWRPQNFDDIIAQDHVVKSLRNQIENQSFGHAYIFSGTRGTGKTSTAKIFAKAVNCLAPVEGNPCNACEICCGINEETVLDVIEMDAASNNSVDDIRELRENVKYSPSKARYKVYIIDEVHMLSTGAFNALLKTLEEPPSYVIFILATTEPHKIPDTILSRCQKYEFRRASQEALYERLVTICDSVNMPFDQEALNRIIQKSGGSVRDTFSALDQVLNAGEDKITLEVVGNSLGLIDDALALNLILNIYKNKSYDVLKAIDQVVHSGKDLVQFVNALIGVARDLMVKSIVQENYEALIKTSDYMLQMLEEGKDEIPPKEMTRILDGLIDLSGKIKYQEHKRTTIEMAFIQLMHPVTKTDVTALVKRIEILEDQINAIKNQPFSDVVAMPLSQKTSQRVLQEEGSVKEKPRAQEQIQKKAAPAMASKATQSVIEDEAHKVEEFSTLTSSDLALDTVQMRWGEFLMKVKKDNPTIYPLIQKSHPSKLSGQRLEIGLDQKSMMFLPILNRGDNLAYMNKRTSQYYKTPLEVTYEIVKEEKLDDETYLKRFLGSHQDVLEIKSE